MARNKKRSKTTSVTKAVRTLTYVIPAGSDANNPVFIDLFKDLSMVNRKLFRQGHVLGIESVDYLFTPSAAYDVVNIAAATAGDSWPVHNAHTKGEALWNEMQQLVLEDNPSVKGKWADYKVYMDGQHFATGNLDPLDAAGNPYLPGQWGYTQYVMPQHVVDPVTGQPILADQTFAHLLGDDVGIPGALDSVGLVKAYQDSRATVHADNPNVPAGMSTSFFNLLTDSGSQEPELADVIELENDDPPYNLDNYPGGPANAPVPVITELSAAFNGSPNAVLTSFVAQCGLIKFWTDARTSTGEAATPPQILIRVNVMAGKYKGVAAIPMGQ